MNRFPLEPLGFLKWIVLSLVVVLTLQTFNIQVLNREVYQKKTMSLVTRSKNIYAERGQIMDRNGVVLADNFRDTANKALDYSRVFLQGKLASQVIGKLDFNGHGVMGVERVFDERLSGNEGFRVSVQDAHRREVYSRSENLAEAVPGKNLVLTIDKNMQELVEKGLKDGVTKYSATSASAVVVDPYTGEILAMASYPTFDPNSKTQGIGRVAKNEIVSMSYEPGSTFKVVTAAAALENNVVDPEKVFANEGKSWSWNPRSAPIRDSHVYGDMNMTQAMVQSSNIVFAKIANEVGADKLYRMARNFGLGMKTSENFYGEESGKLYQPYELTRDDRTLKTMGYGHALLVTPMQMVMVYSTIANGGKLMEPMIVKEWRDANGEVVEKNEPVDSSLMNRIKEVGIYRAIGVTKKNLSYKFFVEANILAVCTVFVGYLLSSIFLIMCTSSSSLMSQVFFYPVWYAIAILIILYAVCIICGILPILSLLRKTPSEILAKYDI